MTTNTIPTEDLYRAVETTNGWAVQGWNGSAYEMLIDGIDKAKAHGLASGMIDDEVESRRIARIERHVD